MDADARDAMANFVGEAQAVLAAGGRPFERIQSSQSSDSVLRSSSSEDDGGVMKTRLAETMKIGSRGSIAVTSRTVSTDDDDAGTINHAGFFGYDAMMGGSPTLALGADDDAPRQRRRVLPASRASMDASHRLQQPAFGATPEHLPQAAVRSPERDGAGTQHAHASPSTVSPSRVAWDASTGGGLPAFGAGGLSDRIQPRQAPVIVDRQRQADARPAPSAELPARSSAEGRPALAPRLAENENTSSSLSDDRWRVAAAYSKADRAGQPPHQAARQSHRAEAPAQRLGRRDIATSLAAQSGQYGQAVGLLGGAESSALDRLKAVRVLGRLHAAGMFEARQPLLRAVDCESKMVRVAAVHELLAAPAASHAIGVEQRIELGRILTRVLDERDDSSGLGLQVVALNALAHLGKSEMGVGSIGDSYTLGVVSALCDSQDPDVRSAAVKAIGSLCKPMDAHYCDRLRPRLQDSDAAVREHTVRTLAHIGAWGGHDALAASLMSACGDPEPAVQRAAVDALVAALEGEQATAARAVMKRVYEQRADSLSLPPLLRMMLEE